MLPLSNLLLTPRQANGSKPSPGRALVVAGFRKEKDATMSNVLTNQLVVELNGVGNVVRIMMRSEELGTKLTRGIVLIGLEKLYFLCFDCLV